MTLDQAIRDAVDDAVGKALARELPQHLQHMQAAPAPDPDRCLSLEDAAAHLGVTVDTVRARIDAGELVAIKLGRYPVVPLASIRSLIARELDRQRFAADQGRAAAAAVTLHSPIDPEIAEMLGLQQAPPRRERVSTTAKKQRGRRSSGAPRGS